MNLLNVLPRPATDTMSRTAHTGRLVHRTLRRFKEKLVNLRADERRFAAAALVCAPFVEMSLRTFGLRRTLDWVEQITADARLDETVSSSGISADRISPERAAAIIDAVYRLQPLRGQCLPRALLQYGLQRRRGAAVRFVVGVKRPSAAGLDAHAWVESIEAPGSSDFSPLFTRSSARAS